MEENKKLLMLAIIKVYKLLEESGKYFRVTYTTDDVNKFLDSDTIPPAQSHKQFWCFAVNEFSIDRIYIYFQGTYNSLISHDMLFSSILVVPNDCFLLKDLSGATKYHVTTKEELEFALKNIKEVL